ncbi:MAG: hypothetical protein FJW20_22950 [Acidimicrobiia bacterium]|nr:hypothetical protein [Acidimicrobiia bacterium]
MDNSRVARLDLTTSDPRLDKKLPLPASVAVLRNPPDGAVDLAVALLQPQAAPADGQRYLIVSGPELDSPDEVRVESFTSETNQIRLKLLHTQVRLQNARLRRNLPWQPIVAVALPADVASGSYTVHVRWQAVQSYPDAKPILGQAPSILSSPVKLD